MEKENVKIKEINLRLLATRIIEKKKYFIFSLPISFVVSCLIIISVPRYYSSEVKLVPELNSPTQSGALGSLASSFGIDLSDMQSTDAISPLLYPELMEDDGFVSEFFNIKVKNSESTISTTYYNYIKKYQKRPWWSIISKTIKGIFPKEKKQTKKKFDAYAMSEEDSKIAQAMRSKINLSVDKKDAIISIHVEDQDPLICKTIADSIKSKLQEYITDYRTSKARNDVEYYKKLTAEAKQKYERARQIYGGYSDANMDVVLESYKAKQEDLENDMQLKYNSYTSLNTQLQAAIAKVQERTPAFTILKGASVPYKPAGPKRMIFVLGIMFLSFMGTLLYIIKDDIIKQLKA